MSAGLTGALLGQVAPGNPRSKKMTQQQNCLTTLLPASQEKQENGNQFSRSSGYREPVRPSPVQAFRRDHQDQLVAYAKLRVVWNKVAVFISNTVPPF